MKHVAFIVILLYVNLTATLCGKTSNDGNKVLLRSKKEEALFDAYTEGRKIKILNPWTYLLWKKIGERDPICTFYTPTMKAVCKHIKKKLEDEEEEVTKISESDNFSYSGCYQFKVKVNNNEYIQRVKQCPFILKSGYAFVSYSFDRSDSYFVYGAEAISNNKGKRKQDHDAKPAQLVALVPVDKKVWFFVEFAKDMMQRIREKTSGKKKEKSK